MAYPAVASISLPTWRTPSLGVLVGTNDARRIECGDHGGSELNLRLDLNDQAEVMQSTREGPLMVVDDFAEGSQPRDSDRSMTRQAGLRQRCGTTARDDNARLVNERQQLVMIEVRRALRPHRQSGRTVLDKAVDLVGLVAEPTLDPPHQAVEGMVVAPDGDQHEWLAVGRS